jgi:hypothetical protein
MGYDQVKKTEYIEIKRKQLATPSMRRDEDFQRINYVRYADDFVIGIEGSYKFTEEIFTRVNNFVENELALRLNPDKTGIVKFSEKHFNFLGYTFMSPEMNGITKAIEVLKTEDGSITRRKKVRVRILSDTNKILARLESKGYIRKRVSHSNHKELV